MNLKKNLHWLLYILFLLACAKQSSPTGGPKDTIPPQLIRTTPAHGTINFNADEIRLEFTELIGLNNPREQLIVTPTIGKNFELTVRKNIALLQLNTKLDSNTTYTFNFREAIQDITEKNTVENLQIALSTGSYIDSLSIEGSVYDMLSGKIPEDVTVALHTPNDTFDILKHPAYYFTKTDKNGNFRIDNLKPDQYYVYAIIDKNRNLIADSRSESYGFLKDPVHLQEDTSNILVPLIRLDTRPLRITSARPFNSYFIIRTSKYMQAVSLRASDTTKLLYSFGDDHASIKIYNTIPDKDSIAVTMLARDSIGNRVDSTLYAKFADREVTPEKFDIELARTLVLADKGQIEAEINLTKPLARITYDSISIVIDSLTRISFTHNDIQYDTASKKLTIRKRVDKSLFPRPTIDPAKSTTRKPDAATAPKNINEIRLGQGAFISAENDSSKRITKKIQPLRTEDLAVIIYDISSPTNQIIVQLLDKAGKVVQEKFNQPKGQFDDLQPEQYMMRVILDSNANRKWDPGNYPARLQPEQIFYYKDEKNSPTINLKPNWEFQLAPMFIKS